MLLKGTMDCGAVKKPAHLEEEAGGAAKRDTRRHALQHASSSWWLPLIFMLLVSYVSNCKQMQGVEERAGYLALPSQLRHELSTWVMAGPTPRLLMQLPQFLTQRLQALRLVEYFRSLRHGCGILLQPAPASHQLFHWAFQSLVLPLAYMLSVTAAMLSADRGLLPRVVLCFQVLVRMGCSYGPISLWNTWRGLRAGNGPSVVLAVVMWDKTCWPCIPVNVVIDKVRVGRPAVIGHHCCMTGAGILLAADRVSSYACQGVLP